MEERKKRNEWQMRGLFVIEFESGKVYIFKAMLNRIV